MLHIDNRHVASFLKGGVEGADWPKISWQTKKLKISKNIVKFKRKLFVARKKGGGQPPPCLPPPPLCYVPEQKNCWPLPIPTPPPHTPTHTKILVNKHTHWIQLYKCTTTIQIREIEKTSSKRYQKGLYYSCTSIEWSGRDLLWEGVEVENRTRIF